MAGLERHQVAVYLLAIAAAGLGGLLLPGAAALDGGRSKMSATSPAGTTAAIAQFS